MQILFLSLIFSIPLFCNEIDREIFHKTIGKIEVYKEKETLNLQLGRVRRLTKNLLTPIHTRDLILSKKTEKHLLTRSHNGPLTVSFFLPLSMKGEILRLLSSKRLTLSIPFTDNESIKTTDIEIDRYASPPKGLFAMRSLIETKLLSPSQVIFIHLLKDEILEKNL